MSDRTDIAVRDVHDIIGCVAHFYEKGNKKEVKMKEEKTKEVQTERR